MARVACMLTPLAFVTGLQLVGGIASKPPHCICVIPSMYILSIYYNICYNSVHVIYNIILHLQYLFNYIKKYFSIYNVLASSLSILLIPNSLDVSYRSNPRYCHIKLPMCKCR